MKEVEPSYTVTYELKPVKLLWERLYELKEYEDRRLELLRSQAKVSSIQFRLVQLQKELEKGRFNSDTRTLSPP